MLLLAAIRYSEGRVRWLLPRVNGEAMSEAGRERKRARQEDPTGAEAMAARHPYGRELDILKEQEEGRRSLWDAHALHRGTGSQQGDIQDGCEAASMTKGIKRSRSEAPSKQELQKEQATEALSWESPEWSASWPLLIQNGESPPEAYEPADPTDVG